MRYCFFGVSLASDVTFKYPSDGCAYLLQQALNPNNHLFEVSIFISPGNQSCISQLAFLRVSTTFPSRTTAV